MQDRAVTLDPGAHDRRSRGPFIGLVGAVAVTVGVFVYLWVAHGLPAAAWLLPLVWVPAMIANYLALRTARVTNLALVVFVSLGLFFLTTFAVYAQAGESAGIVVAIAGFLVFAGMLTAGAYLFEQMMRPASDRTSDETSEDGSDQPVAADR